MLQRTHPGYPDSASAYRAGLGESQPESAARQVFRKKLREGQLDDKEIEVDLVAAAPQLEIMGPAGMEEMTEQLRGMFGQMGQNKRQTRKLKVAQAQVAGRRRGCQAGQ